MSYTFTMLAVLFKAQILKIKRQYVSKLAVFFYYTLHREKSITGRRKYIVITYHKSKKKLFILKYRIINMKMQTL